MHFDIRDSARADSRWKICEVRVEARAWWDEEDWACVWERDEWVSNRSACSSWRVDRVVRSKRRLASSLH